MEAVVSGEERAPSVSSAMGASAASASVAAVVSAAPVESTRRMQEVQEHRPSAPPVIPRYLGALLVKAPPEGTVYVSGVPLGETGEWLQLTCNRHHFIRIGTKPGPLGLRGTSWLVPGQSVMIRCGEAMEVSGTPRYFLP